MSHQRPAQRGHAGSNGVVIGLTGGIATGKSTIGALLVEKGAILVDADRIAHEIYAPGSSAHRQIVQRFGRDVLCKDGSINRQLLGNMVFGEPALRLELERITHPEIATRLFEEIAGQKAISRIVVADIPLLFERNYQTLFDGVLLAWCPEPLQIKRICTRDGISPTEALQRVAAQMPIAEKRALATWIIDTSLSLEQTSSQVESWWQSLARNQGPV